VIGAALFLVAAIAVWVTMEQQAVTGATFAAVGGVPTVQYVSPGSPADAAGLQPGDVVRSADGFPITQPEQLQKILAQGRPGDTLELGLQHAGSSSDMGSLYYTEIVAQPRFIDPDGVQFSIMTLLGLSIVGVAVVVLWPDISDKLGWTRLATLFIVALFLVLTIGMFIRIGLTGTSGIVSATSGPPVIESIASGSPAERAGVRAGDILVSVDGQPTPTFSSASRIVGRYRTGDTLRYVVQRAGSAPGADSLYSADITLQSQLWTRFGLRGPSQAAAVGLLTLGVAAAVTFLRPGVLAARVLLVASAAFAVGLNSLAWQTISPDPTASGYLWQLRWYVGLFVLGPAALVHLSLIFPRRSPLLVRLDSVGPAKLRVGRLALPIVAYAAPVAIGLTLVETASGGQIGALHNAIQAGDMPLLRPLPGQANWTSAIVFVVGALLAGAVLALSYTYLHPPSASARVQVRWILAAMVVLFVSQLWGLCLPVLLDYLRQQRVALPPPPIPEQLAWMALPLAVGLAIIRNQMFDIRLVLRATLLYAPLTVLLVGAYLGLVFIISRLAVDVLGASLAADPTVSVVAALGMAALAYPLRQRLQRLLERAFYREQLARRRFLNAANEALGRAQRPAAVAEFLTGNTTALLGLIDAWIVVPTRFGLPTSVILLHPDEELPAELLRGTGACLLQRPDDQSDADDPGDSVLAVQGAQLSRWYAAGARLLVPLRGADSTNPDLLGVWLLGARRSGAAFDREDLQACARVGHQAAVLLENAQLQEEQVQQTVVRRELDRAREIQLRLLPQQLAGWPGLLEIAARFRPARETSGDFYDLLSLGAASDSEEKRLVPLLLAVGDVAGKGIAAALVTALARTALRAAAEPGQVADGQGEPVEAPDGHSVLTSVTAGRGGRVIRVPAHTAPRPAVSPAVILTRAGMQLHRDLGPRDFVACALVVLEPPHETWQTPRLRLANAGQVPPLLCRGGEVCELVPEGERLPLGVLPNPSYQELATELQPGDVVVLSSDGLPEAPNQSVASYASSEFFGFDRLVASAAAWAATPLNAEAVADGIWEDVIRWSGADAHHDDMTLLVLRVPNGQPAISNRPDGW
jgi:serine phosphatase RsbU (regulator of sigma subunit)